MSLNMILLFLVLIIPITAIQIPVVRNVTFISLSKSNNRTLNNHSCNQCICMASSSDLILNCFPNNTCQFFSSFFPRTYKTQRNVGANLYFLQSIFPNASQCCMPDLTALLNKIKSSTQKSGRVLQPRCLTMDDRGYIATVSETNNTIVRFNSTNMTLINQTYRSFPGIQTIKYYNKHYYVGLTNRIVVVDSDNLTIRNNITSINLDISRDMIFMDNGNRLIVASTDNNSLLFFNRLNNLSSNYNYAGQQGVNYTYPHGLLYINDTYFYSTSWMNNSIYSYSAIQNSTRWNEKRFIGIQSQTSSGAGAHVSVDECGRFWFSLFNYGLKIFDSHGSFLANLTFTNTSIFDTIITDNYVMYLSDQQSNRVIRIDPNIEC